MSACSSCSVFCQISAEPGRLTLRHVVQPWDILSDIESYFTQIHCQEAHTSSLMFCQDSQWDRMSNLQTGCPTSRHTVWSSDMPHRRSLPRRLLQDCIQALSYFVKTINGPECLIWRQAVQLQDIPSDPETWLTRLLPRRPWQDCMQALSSFFKNVNEQIVWLWDRAAAMWQNITRLGIGTIITWIVIWITFSVNVPVNHLK